MKKSIICGVALLVSTMMLASCDSGEVGNVGSGQDKKESVKEEDTQGEKKQLGDEKTKKKNTDQGENQDKDAVSGKVRQIQICSMKEYVGESDDDGCFLVSAYYPTIWTEEEEYGNLSDFFEQYNEEVKTTQEEEIREFVEMAKEARQYGSWDEDGYYTSYCDAMVLRADSNIASILNTYSSFAGGAHGSYYYGTYNVDTATGQKLGVKDVFRDTGVLADKLEDALLSEYDREMFYVEDISASILDMLEQNGDMEFTMGYQGITFYFAPYVLAPYAAGAQVVTVGYDECGGLLNDAYAKMSSDYIMPIQTGKAYTLSSGVNMSLEIESSDLGQNQDEWRVKIQCGSQLYEEEMHSFRFAPYLVCVDGKDYLYLQRSEENDYENISIYALEDHGARKLEDIYRGFRYDTPTDPSNMELMTRTDLLSTNNCWRSFHVDADGSLVPNDDCEYIIGSVAKTLSLKREITAQVVLSANKLEEETFPAGTVFTFYATDNETYVDMKTEDERVVRFYVDTTEFPQRIDGVDIEEIFDGVMFAG